MNELEIFSAAIQLKAAEDREKYLAEACADNQILRERIESLLRAAFNAGSSREPHAPTLDLAATIDRPMAEKPGSQIGPYKLLQQIGEGGMGVVYMAEQQKPVQRRVALKIIKPGMDSGQVIARFEAERQALAMMDHPNIARVLDAGCTASGLPYFAMELVQGIAITKHCDDKQLSPRERLELFIQVCRAVQHAHQKGIIHRDLKPSNVLVMIYDGKPIPKIIDFGVAKALHQKLTDRTMFTQFGAIVGTLECMSPEQAEMDILSTDTRSDIYSLGVLLYELLTGTTPLDGKQLCSLGYAEMLKTIREVEPPKPSTRLSQSVHDLANISAKRHTEPARLQKLVAGDLDWIVMKCLEKDRTQRYQTANGLALDIQRHLNNEPIAARPPSAAYRARKFVRRNKLPVVAAAVVALAILSGLGLAVVGFFRANVERNRAVAALAEAERQKALADGNFREARRAVEDLLRISDERLKDQHGLQPLRMELMKAAIDRYEPFLAQPIPDPTPREELARLYAQYGMIMLEGTEVLDQSVMAEFEKARNLQEQLLKEHPGDRTLRSNLGWTLILEEWRPHKVPPRPEQSGRQAIEIFKRLVAEDPTDRFARDDLVWALWRIARYVGPAERTTDVDQAVAIGEQLVEQYPASVEFRRDLANALSVKSLVTRELPPASVVRASTAEASSAPGALSSQLTAKALSIHLRSLELFKAELADVAANKPEALQPQRPETDEGRMFNISPMWATYDLGLHTFFTAEFYHVLHDWPNAAKFYDRSAVLFEELSEHNPSIATFTAELDDAFNGRISVAERMNDRRQTAARSKEALSFWTRQVELHPDIPALRQYADAAAKQDAELAKPPANPTKQP